MFDVLGWWFDACGPSNLNGMYYQQGQNSNRFNGIKWYYWKGSGYSLKSTTMMIRPRDFSGSVWTVTIGFKTTWEVNSAWQTATNGKTKKFSREPKHLLKIFYISLKRHILCMFMCLIIWIKWVVAKKVWNMDCKNEKYL